MAIPILPELAAIAIAYVLLTIVVQRKLINYKRIKEIKKEMDSKMKELKQMGTTATKDMTDAKQKEIMLLTSESMKHQIKGMIIILPISILLYYIALPALFPAQATVSVLSYTLPYKTFFIIVAFVLGLISTMMLSLYERAVAKRQQPVPAQ
ncbi:MAG: EMC3/TMCO1 family protein [Candidatus Micrarchaeaceae archaeon]